MLTFTDATAGDDSVGIDPGRVDFLLGEPASLRFPIALCLAPAAVIAFVAAATALASHAAAGSATLASPLVTSRPCVVVVALVLGAVLFGSARYISSRLQLGRHRRNRQAG